MEAAKSLEALNPTDSPATSPLINGRWSLLYQGESDYRMGGKLFEAASNLRMPQPTAEPRHLKAVLDGRPDHIWSNQKINCSRCRSHGAVARPCWATCQAHLAVMKALLHCKDAAACFTTGPEEVTRKREPLEGPVINFFRPILGFLFKTLVSMPAVQDSHSILFFTPSTLLITERAAAFVKAAVTGWGAHMPLVHTKFVSCCRACSRSSTPTAALWRTWCSSSLRRRRAAR